MCIPFRKIKFFFLFFVEYLLILSNAFAETVRVSIGDKWESQPVNPSSILETSYMLRRVKFVFNISNFDFRYRGMMVELEPVP